MPLKRAALPPYRVTSPGRSLELETTAYLVRLGAAGGATPTNNFIVAVDDFIRSQKAHGVWSLRDAIYLYAVPDLATAFVNLKSSSFPCTAGGGAPSVAGGKGLVFNGTSDYIKTGVTPSTSGGQFAQNAANMSVWLAAYSTTGYFAGQSSARIGPAATGYGSFSFRMNQASTSGLPSANLADRASGMISINRASSASAELYHEGALNYSAAVASAAVDTNQLYIGGNISGAYCGCTIPYAAIGGALTAQQVQQERDDVAALLRALGALPNAAWLPVGTYASNGSLLGGTQFGLQNAGQPWSLQRDGASFMRIELRPGDRWATDAANEPGATRSELYAAPFANDQTYWTAFDFMIEPGFVPAVTGVGNFFILCQHHPKNGAAGAQPSHSVEIVGSNLIFNTSDGTTKTGRYTTTFVPGVWYRVVTSIYNDPSNGAFSVWLNGTQVVNLASGLAVGQSGDAPYAKFGLYGTGSLVTSPFAIRYANVNVGTTSLAGLVTAPGPLPALAA